MYIDEATIDDKEVTARSSTDNITLPAIALNELVNLKVENKEHIKLINLLLRRNLIDDNTLQAQNLCDKNEKLTDARDELKRNDIDLVEKEKGLNDMVFDLVKRVEELERDSADRVALEIEAMTSHKLNEESTRELQQKNEEISKLSRKIKIVTNNKNQLKNNNKKLVQQLNQQHTKIKDFEKEINHLKSQVAERQNEVVQLKRERRSRKDTARVASTTKDHLSLEVEAVTKEMNNYLQLNSRLQEKNYDLSQDIKNLEKTIQTLQRQNECLNNDNTEKKNQITCLEKERLDMESTSTDTVTKISKESQGYKDQADNLASQLKERDSLMNNVVTLLEKQNDAKDKEIETLKNKIDIITNNKWNLYQKYYDLDKMNDGLKTKIEYIKLEHHSLCQKGYELWEVHGKNKPPFNPFALLLGSIEFARETRASLMTMDKILHDGE